MNFVFLATFSRFRVKHNVNKIDSMSICPYIRRLSFHPSICPSVLRDFLWLQLWSRNLIRICGLWTAFQATNGIILCWFWRGLLIYAKEWINIFFYRISGVSNGRVQLVLIENDLISDFGWNTGESGLEKCNRSFFGNQCNPKIWKNHSDAAIQNPGAKITLLK